MKQHTHSARAMAGALVLVGLASGITAHAQVPHPAAQQMLTTDIVPLPVVNESINLGHMNPNTKIIVTLGITPADPQGLENFAHEVCNPASPLYGKFLTPQEIGQRFGISDAQYMSIVAYLQSEGFTIRDMAAQRFGIIAESTVGQAEHAFGTEIDMFQALNANVAGNPSYYAFTSPIKAPASVAPYLVAVEGMESFTKPKHMSTLTPTLVRPLYGSSTMYTAGYTGLGRTIAISNWDGVNPTLNGPVYYSTYFLPTPAGGVGTNITRDTTAGNSGTSGVGEGDLDFQLPLGMAPLATMIIYDGGAGNLLGVLQKEANDNLADVISESYGWNISGGTLTSAHTWHTTMTAQGITYMCASGDSGTTLAPYYYPNMEPEVMSVGGTIAAVNGSGVRTSEQTWQLNAGGAGWGGGGGWANITTFTPNNTRPTWQVGTGVSTTINHRLVPDMLGHACGSTAGANAHRFAYGGAITGAIGTSLSAPINAGGFAVVMQKLIALGGLPPNGAGKRRLGRLQDVIYAQNGRTDVWFDITTGGTIGTLPDATSAVPTAKWDYASGWGAINYGAFVDSMNPSLSSLSPGSANAGSSAFTLTVNGTNFYNGSVIKWNGAARTTTYVSGSQLTASISAADVATAGVATVTVTNPVGLTSAGLAFNINNAVPSLASINPSSKVTLSPGFTLSVTGSNFISTSVVQWNGSNLTTTFVDSSHLTASVPAGNLTTAGSFPITVFTPAPGGGTSSPLNFNVSKTTVSGTVTLGDYPDATGVDVVMEIRAVGSTTPIVTKTVTLSNAGGSYSTQVDIAPGTYDVAFKPSHWLRSIAHSTVFASASVSASVSVVNGDVDGNNQINTDDYLAFSDAFDTVVGDPNYSADADLNGDGQVTTDDYLIFSEHFDTIGED